MRYEEKQILLKDLCGRLPYNFVYCYCNAPLANGKPIILTPVVISNLMNATDDLILKPYLRPMSSMTEEEFESLKQYSGLEYDQLDLASFPNNHKCLDFYLSEIPAYIVILVYDWLNAHHFDYRGLIPMGLALEAPEDMYKTE